ncbi:MAG: response regulator transcription factor [Halomonadaceae bacterium]|uniref:Response regulator transcription factor n=1 Tax=Halomonas colorata TaxID=2742615 RepID=A0ABR9G2M4_9GAMM|nr:response regulator transcription factor [Halomonas colorata]MBE0465139.1 response regulator transcription factor [Halomonas colorata]
MKIAVVEDESVMYERMHKALYNGFVNRGIQTNISAFATSSAFIHTASRETFDLVLLDWHLPDGTGIALLDWMKKYLEMLPAVIIVTHRQEETDVIQALDAGADDFISKPFRPRELAARAYAASRRKLSYTSNQAHQLKFGRIKLNTQKETACIDGQSITLTHQEFRLAYLLLNRLDSPLSRAYLYKYVWGRDKDLNTRTLDVHIHRIRKKLLLTAEYGWNLVSVYGYGYRLQAIKTNNKVGELNSA